MDRAEATLPRMGILALLYQADCGPGVFGEAARARGIEVDGWLVPEGDGPPADPAGYDAIFVFGGAMHSDQEDGHPWLRTQKGMVRKLFEAGTPILATCLGAQLLAEATGGSVRRMPGPEIGWFDVELTPEGLEDPVTAALGPGFTAFNWHSYECVPPTGATVLARSAACIQAFSVGERAWGIQFHAEVSRTSAENWIDDWDQDEDAVRIGLDPEALRARTRERLPGWNQVGRGLCARFLDTIAIPANRA